MTLQYLKTLDPGSKAYRDDRYTDGAYRDDRYTDGAYRDDRYTDGIYLAMKRLSVVVKQPMDFQSIVVELKNFLFLCASAG